MTRTGPASAVAGPRGRESGPYDGYSGDHRDAKVDLRRIELLVGVDVVALTFRAFTVNLDLEHASTFEIEPPWIFNLVVDDTISVHEVNDGGQGLVVRIRPVVKPESPIDPPACDRDVNLLDSDAVAPEWLLRLTPLDPVLGVGQGDGPSAGLGTVNRKFAIGSLLGHLTIGGAA